MYVYGGYNGFWESPMYQPLLKMRESGFVKVAAMYFMCSDSRLL